MKILRSIQFIAQTEEEAKEVTEMHAKQYTKGKEESAFIRRWVITILTFARKELFSSMLAFLLLACLRVQGG